MSVTNTAVRRALTRRRFRAWLENRRRKVVGRAGQGAQCPLATYLKDETGSAEVHVGRFVARANGARVDLPPWAWRFVQGVDWWGALPRYPRGTTKKVTGAKALSILERP